MSQAFIKSFLEPDTVPVAWGNESDVASVLRELSKVSPGSFSSREFSRIPVTTPDPLC